jgi:hypothetical protein
MVQESVGVLKRVQLPASNFQFPTSKLPAPFHAPTGHHGPESRVSPVGTGFPGPTLEDFVARAGHLIGCLGEDDTVSLTGWLR